jgi:hypothetical protein
MPHAYAKTAIYIYLNGPYVQIFDGKMVLMYKYLTEKY